MNGRERLQFPGLRRQLIAAALLQSLVVPMLETSAGSQSFHCRWQNSDKSRFVSHGRNDPWIITSWVIIRCGPSLSR